MPGMQKSWSYDPYFEICALIPEASNAEKCSLEDCMQTFAADEIRDGEEMYRYGVCKQKRKCVKKM